MKKHSQKDIRIKKVSVALGAAECGKNGVDARIQTSVKIDWKTEEILRLLAKERGMSFAGLLTRLYFDLEFEPARIVHVGGFSGALRTYADEQQKKRHQLPNQAKP